MLRAFARIGIVTVNVFLWAFFLLTSVLFFLVAVVLRVTTWPFDPNLKILHAFSCFWAAVYVWVNPFWALKRKGLQHAERGKAYVIVANHQSMADILVLYSTFLHFKWVSKKSMFNVPLLGWNMRMNGYVPIDRGSDESREKCLSRCRDWLAMGSSVLFFPEGTRSPQAPKMLPFKIGSFRLALESGHEILPLVIKGSADAIPKHSMLLHRKSRISLEALPPIPVHSFQGNPSGAESLMNHVRTMMKARLG